MRWHTPAWIARSVRNKLLAMALLPLAMVLPLLVLVLMLWSSLAYDRLLITKIRSDLAVASGYFEQTRNEVGSGTLGVASSYKLQAGLLGPVPALQNRDLMRWLDQEKQRLALDFLVLDFETRLSADTPPAAQLQLLAPSVLQRLAPHTLSRTRIALVPTRNAAPTERQHEDRAMVMLASLPVLNEAGEVLATLHGGLMLNQNLDFIDHINRIVYPEGSLPFGSQGTATLFLDDVRITTNVRLFQNERAIGTRVSETVRNTVLRDGNTWLDRAFVVDDWYVSAYQPLLDAQGQRIGMLYVGFLEQPFRWVRYGMLAAIVVIFLGVMALAALFSVRWARSIFHPVQQMNQTMVLVESGLSDARVGPVKARDELGALANHLDELLDVIEDKTQSLRRWGEELDAKVAERTRDLELSNQSLQQTQQQLVKSEKLAAVGQLTASIAHEINNPIAVIQGNLDLLRETLGAAADPVRPELKLMDEQVERMRLIVTQLLQYARPTEYAGYVVALDVNQLVADSLVLVAHLVQQRRVQVATQWGATQAVGCNRQELQQVVINLMINAIQAMPQGGRLTLRTRDWLDSETATPQGAIIEVLDEGPGLSDAVSARLFTPFFTTKNDGNGLGLWISLGLVERYGGRLEAVNRADMEPTQREPQGEPQQGACFRVLLLTEPQIPDEARASTRDGRPGQLASGN